MNVTKTVQQLVLSKDADNYKIASEILRVHPDLHTAIYFAFSYCQELLSFTWGDGEGGNGEGGGNGNCAYGVFANFENSGYGYPVGDGNIDYQ
jgi:hypothetical protein